VTINKSKMESWSILTPTPVFYYNEEIDEQLVVWNGIHMIPEHALMVASSLLWKIAPTPEMKQVADTKFRKIYYLNGFGKQDPLWNRIIEEKYADNAMFSFYIYYLHDHITKKLGTTPPEDVFKWFAAMYN
jgi:hypothetical protein